MKYLFFLNNIWIQVTLVLIASGCLLLGIAKLRNMVLMTNLRPRMLGFILFSEDIREASIHALELLEAEIQRQLKSINIDHVFSNHSAGDPRFTRASTRRDMAHALLRNDEKFQERISVHMYESQIDLLVTGSIHCNAIKKNTYAISLTIYAHAHTIAEKKFNLLGTQQETLARVANDILLFIGEGNHTYRPTKKILPLQASS